MAAERGPLLRMVLLTCAAAAVGLVAPYLVGRIVDLLEAGTATVSAVDGLAVAAVACALATLVLNRYAKLSAFRFGERALARLREEFVDRVLALPTRVVERSGTGDLTTRVTADVATAGATLRTAVPDIVPSSLRILFLLAAVFWLSPLLGAVVLLGVPPAWLVVHWYLRRSREAYLAEGAAGSAAVEGVTATVQGGRTVEAFALGGLRVAAADRDAVEVYRARRRTLYLRSVLYPVTDIAFSLPAVVVLLVGGLLYLDGRVALGVVVTCCLYMLRVQDSAGWIMVWIELLQRSGASFARVFGVGSVAVEPPPPGPVAADDRIEVRDVHYAYVDGRDVLRGITLSVRPGERWAIVGPSGAGKSTLGRLLAGADAPRSGLVLVGGVPVTDLGTRELRERIVLVSQEHHVFAGTLRENLEIAAEEADDAALAAALEAVDAGWAAALPRGLDTPLGPGGIVLDPARAQQVALARVVLADPHTVVLDEATSLLDPTTARQAERSLAAVLEGRTVIAIAHRLHTAHDADRIAVVEDGRITELGSHDELVDADGPYAALWRSWHGDRTG
ncbi:ABC transporter ATP-binding protein [Nocardiopsis sp. CC223A]|uniref:ABC transporter ATP-binding protein n=1 Tax=Nocardiopsis sp. CC223A TaxID=3044051 RepID=UPI00278C2379|nr:ABC transporter ATP-binding protein [Nocardiopsis sp. CC223A]